MQIKWRKKKLWIEINVNLYNTSEEIEKVK